MKTKTKHHQQEQQQKLSFLELGRWLTSLIPAIERKKVDFFESKPDLQSEIQDRQGYKIITSQRSHQLFSNFSCLFHACNILYTWPTMYRTYFSVREASKYRALWNMPGTCKCLAPSLLLAVTKYQYYTNHRGQFCIHFNCTGTNLQ